VESKREEDERKGDLRQDGEETVQDSGVYLSVVDLYTSRTPTNTHASAHTQKHSVRIGDAVGGTKIGVLIELRRY